MADVGLLYGPRASGALGSMDAFGNFTPTRMQQMGVLDGPVHSARQGAGIEALAGTWPAKLAQAFLGGVTLPGDVYAGRVNPNSDEAVGRAADLAGLVTLGAGAIPQSANTLRMGAAPKRPPGRLQPGDRAALQIGDRIIDGNSHYDALLKAQKEFGEDIADRLGNESYGIVRGGKFFQDESDLLREMGRSQPKPPASA